MTLPDDVERLFASVLRRWGRVDVLFNNAGVFGPGFRSNATIGRAMITPRMAPPEMGLEGSTATMPTRSFRAR